jgi:hypothetical protein
MTPYDFAKVRASQDLEAATHAVFDAVYEKWITIGTDSLTTGERTTYCVETVFGEVCNGGIAQYLDNESGLLAVQAPDALQRVGLPHYAAIIAEALSMCEQSDVPEDLDSDDPRSRFIEWNLKNGTPESAMEELESKFSSLYSADKTEFRRKLFEYIVNHEEEFVSRD